MKVIMIHKAASAKEWFDQTDGETFDCKICKRIHMGKAEFDTYSEHLQDDTQFIIDNPDVCGEDEEGNMLCFEVTCDAVPYSLIIGAEGYKYARYMGIAVDVNSTDPKAPIREVIFKTRANYSHGFMRQNSEEDNRTYIAAVKALEDAILADLKRAPEIIVKAYTECELLKYRTAFTKGSMNIGEYNAVVQAVNHVVYALTDTAPLAELK